MAYWEGEGACWCGVGLRECEKCGKTFHDYEITNGVCEECGGVKEARFGYNGIVKSPTLFLAGEAGREHVRIKPMRGSKPRRSNIYDWRNFI